MRKKIEEALHGVHFENREEVEEARKKLINIPGKKVIKYISDASRHWHYTEFLYGIKNIEEVFGAKFDLKRLVEMYFTEPDMWYLNQNQAMLTQFNDITGREVTANDVADLIDIEFVRESIEFDVGILGFAQFIEDNGGNAQQFLERLSSMRDLSPYEKYEISLCTP